VRKQFQEISRKCFIARKILEKSQTIPGKFLEINWNMNNPNKVFGVQEKDFRAF
jgi:hypothetical protein